MSALPAAVAALLQTARGGGTDAAVGAALRMLAAEETRATGPERVDAMRELARVVGHESYRVAGIAALAAGAMAEAGTPPHELAGPLLVRVTDVLARARTFRDAVIARAAGDAPQGEEDAPHGEESGDPTGDEEPPGVDTVEITEGVFVAAARVQETMVADGVGGAAWYHLRHWCLPTITLLSMSSFLRGELGPMVAPMAEAMQESSPYARFLTALLRVLDDERILVLHPTTDQAWWARITGIADNFQLQTLLQAALADLGVPCERPHPEVLASALGEGPQESGRSAVGSWNVYDGRAAGLDVTNALRVPRDLWVWGEGSPADIPRIAGIRCIVLGPGAYARSWNGIRVFTHLRASLVIEGALTAAELAKELVRLRGAEA